MHLERECGEFAMAKEIDNFFYASPFTEIFQLFC